METFSALLPICAGNYSPVPVNSQHKGQWRGALMFSLICIWLNVWVNNRVFGDLRRHRAHYDVTVIKQLTECDVTTTPDTQPRKYMTYWYLDVLNCTSGPFRGYHMTCEFTISENHFRSSLFTSMWKRNEINHYPKWHYLLCCMFICQVLRNVVVLKYQTGHTTGDDVAKYGSDVSYASSSSWSGPTWKWHYNNIIMGGMASEITGLTIVYSVVDSGADQRKHQSSASLAFVRGIHRWPVNSPHKGPVTRKMFPFDDVIMGRAYCWHESRHGESRVAHDANTSNSHWQFHCIMLGN